MEPRYSIIVPVYNVAPYLSECLDSVLRQHVVDWECLCVDDGSTDGSAEILDAYQRRDNRFRVLHKSNGGVSSARNVALDMCCGKWIVYVDADDVLVDDALSIFTKIEGEVPDATLLHYEICQISESARDCHLAQDVASCKVFQERDRSKIVPGYNGISFITYAYRRDLLGGLRYKPYAIGEDRLYLAAAHALCRCKAWCSAIGYGCRQRRNSASRSVWTLQKYRDSLSARRDSVALVESAGVQLVRRSRRMIYQAILESSVADILLVDKACRRQAWDELFCVLGILDVSRVPTPWQRMVLQVLNASHSVALGWIMCIWPHRMKALKSRYVKWRRNGKRKGLIR